MIVLIGATTFLGPEVLTKLLESGYKVKCFVRPGSTTDKLKEIQKDIDITPGNLNSSDSIFSSIKEAEAVVYLPDLKNTYYVKNLLGAAKRARLDRLIFISSTTVLGPQETEEKAAKIKSENLIEKSDLDFTILRPTMIYGVPDDTNFSKMLAFIKKNNYFYVFGSGENLIQPVYIEDVAKAVASIVKNKKTFSRTYELPGKEPLSYNRMLDIVKEKTGINFKVRKMPMGLSKFFVNIYSKLSPKPRLNTGQIERLKYDKTYPYDDARKDFGYSPIGFEQGIEYLIKKLNL
ncbi:MAG: NAD(P)H-binding protein [Candidatus Humimicrobiaceae bacterium]